MKIITGPVVLQKVSLVTKALLPSAMETGMPKWFLRKQAEVCAAALPIANQSGIPASQLFRK